jgi:hypothetical protein
VFGFLTVGIISGDVFVQAWYAVAAGFIQALESLST